MKEMKQTQEEPIRTKQRKGTKRRRADAEMYEAMKGSATHRRESGISRISPNDIHLRGMPL